MFPGNFYGIKRWHYQEPNFGVDASSDEQPIDESGLADNPPPPPTKQRQPTNNFIEYGLNKWHDSLVDRRERLTARHQTTTNDQENASPPQSAPEQPRKLGPRNQGLNNPWQRAKNGAAQKASSTGLNTATSASKLATRVGVKTAAHGGALAAEALAGPAGWALAALDVGITILNTLRKKRVFQAFYWGGVFLILTFLFLSLPLISLYKNKDLPGADHDGSRNGKYPTDSYAPHVATGESGFIIADSLEAYDFATKNLTTLLNKQPPAGANLVEAKKILTELTLLQAKVKTQAFATDKKAEAEVLAQYKKLINQLYDALYPGRKVAQARVLSLINTRIFPATGAGCSPQKDLNGLGLTENTLNVLYATALHSPITLTCLMTGHRKYVGKPPSQGYPRCGSPALIQGGVGSLHCLGRAFDIAPDAQIEAYLKQNQAQLKLRKVLDEGNHLHIEVLP